MSLVAILRGRKIRFASFSVRFIPMAALCDWQIVTLRLSSSACQCTHVAEKSKKQHCGIVMFRLQTCEKNASPDATELFPLVTSRESPTPIAVVEQM